LEISEWETSRLERVKKLVFETKAAAGNGKSARSSAILLLH
jgi:hypothetical protein